jgi:hypothetical protein
MQSRTFRSGLAASLMILTLAAPAAAAPTPDAARPDPGAATGLGRMPDADFPTDRPIVARVVDIDEATGTIMLETPHGPVQLAVSPELVENLTIGDVVVVRFTDEDDYPAASPREEPAPDRTDRTKI